MAGTGRAMSLLQEFRWRGFWGSVQAIKTWRFASSQFLVGTDDSGNRYFENRGDFYGRDRWIEYAEARNLQHDPLGVPPDWHAWLLHSVDEAPSQHPMEKPVYQSAVLPNQTGTPDAYVSRHHPLAGAAFAGHAREKIEGWVPSVRTKGGRATTQTTAAAAGSDILDLK